MEEMEASFSESVRAPSASESREKLSEGLRAYSFRQAQGLCVFGAKETPA